jgi:hypothetical protein
MLRKLALFTVALTLGAFVTPAPATAAPAQIQAQCPVGSYSSTLPPYYTNWHIGSMVDGVRYWHTVTSTGNYAQSSITGCSSSGAQLWSRALSITATGGDRCEPATSSTRYQFVGEYRHAVVSGSFFYFVYYRYWHVRTLEIILGQPIWRYSHSELARC